MPLSRKRPEDRTATWRARRPVRLYLDDVDDILAVMSQVGSVEASTDEFRGTIESSSDLEVIGQRTVKFLSLATGDGMDKTLSVSIGELDRIVITARDDLKLMGAAQAIDRVFVRRERRWLRILPFKRRSLASDAVLETAWPVLLVSFGIAFVVTGIAVHFDDNDRPTRQLEILLIVAGLILLVATTVLVRVSKVTDVLIVAYRSEAPTWWERRRSDIIIGLITNALVGAVFFAIGLWVAG